MRSAGSDLVSALASAFCGTSARPSSSSAARLRLFGGLFRLVGLDDVDAHVGQHRHDVFDLVGRDFLGRQHRVQLVVGDVAARLGGFEQLLDGLIGKIEQRAVALGRLGRGLVLVFGLLGRLGCACHRCPSPCQIRLHASTLEGQKRFLRNPYPYRGAAIRSAASNDIELGPRSTCLLRRTARLRVDKIHVVDVVYGRRAAPAARFKSSSRASASGVQSRYQASSAAFSERSRPS